MEKEIFIKSLFYGWKPATKEQAMKFAKCLNESITTMEGKQKVDYINSRLKGITVKF